MALRPPQHSVDAPGVYILKADDSWDNERIDLEVSEAAKGLVSWKIQCRENEELRRTLSEDQWPVDPPHPPLPGQHPVERYRNAETRYDIDAPMQWMGDVVRVTDYLSGTPTRFHLRILPPEVYGRCWEMNLRNFRAQEEGREFDLLPLALECVRHGVDHIDGPDFGFEVRSRKVTDAALQALMSAAGGALALMDLGGAIWRFTQPLTDQEKKA